MSGRSVQSYFLITTVAQFLLLAQEQFIHVKNVTKCIMGINNGDIHEELR